MIYQIPFRLSQKSLPWVKAATKYLPIRNAPFSEYYDLAKLSKAMRVPRSQLVTVIAHSRRIHALQFDGNIFYVHPDGLAKEVHKLVTTTIKNLIPMLKDTV